MRIVAERFPSIAAAGAAVIIALIPIHAFLTVWLASLFGGYDAWRLWKEGLLVALALLVGYGLLCDRRWRQSLRAARPLWWLMVGYAVLHLVLGVWALLSHRVNLEALAYALIINVRFLLFFWLCYALALRVGWLRQYWLRLVLVPAAVVVGFGLLQAVVLPVDFLRHFGYGPATIPAYQTVDQKLAYQRVQSTLRGSNPLGAYLVVVIAAAAAWLSRRQAKRWKQVAVGGLLAGSLVVLGFSYSRSAYLGAVLAAGLVLWLLAGQKLRRWLLVAAAGLVLVGAGSLLALRQNTRFDNTFFHTDRTSTSASSSNSVRWRQLSQAAGEVVREPLGRGPGTAGPASAHNNHPSRLAENYYLQIAQETGWLGLGLFAAVLVLVARGLWPQRRTVLGAVLLGSLLGISIINLVSHAWADDTLSLLWWGLAGIGSATAILDSGANTKSTKVGKHG